MRIKQVILEGFKTYREKTVVDFESGINIIVGPNGVGKTNLLMALQFVLSHEYHTMPQKKLLQMMNNIMQQQTLPRIFVEITLDNMDRSLPEDSNEVKISREVANGKDLYHLNGRSISKDQIKSTLHTAGFSRVNSYHVIKQGNVTNLALASDADRLKMLKEAAGYNFWEELKLKGERNLDEAKSNLEGVRKNIQDRKEHLDKLEREHSEFMRWEALNNKKKAVNACMSIRDRSRVIARISQCEEQRKKKTSSVSLARMKLADIEESKADAEKQLDLRQDELNSLQNMLEDLNKSAKTLAVDLTSLDLEIKERERKIQLPEEEASLREKLSALEQEIKDKENEFEIHNRELKQTLDDECRIKNGLMRIKERQLELISRSAQTEKFADQRERDDWITAQTTNLNKNLNQIKKEIIGLTNAIEIEENQQNEIKKKLSELEAKKIEEFEELRQLKVQDAKLKDRLRRLQLQQSEISRRTSEQDLLLRDAIKDLVSKFRNFCNVVPRPIAKSIKNVNDVLERMANESPETEAHKQARLCHGLLINQFTYEEDMAIAIEAIAGNKLFYHIAEDEEVANAILDRIEAENLEGDTQFYTLKNLQCKSIGTDPINGAVPIMKFLSITKQETRMAVEQVFGKWLLCHTLDEACDTAQNLKLDCVTLQGHKAFANGAIHGGFQDSSRLRAKLYREVEKAQSDLAARKEEHKKSCEELRQVREEINAALSDIQKNRTATEHIDMGKILEEIEVNRKSDALFTQSIHCSMEQLRKMNISMDAIQAKVESFNQQSHESFTPGLLPAEEMEISILQDESSQVRRTLKELEDKRQRLEMEICKMDFELNENLMKRRLLLEKNLNDMLKDENHYDMIDDAVLTEMKSKQHELLLEQEKKAAKIEETQSKIVLLKESNSRMKEDLENIKSSRRERKRNLETFETQLRETENEYKALKDRELAIMEKVTEYESGQNEELFKKYSSYSNKKLEGKLVQINDKLGRFKKVNQKAVLEYTASKEKLERLNRKLPTLMEDGAKTEGTLDAVEAQRNEFVQYSLQQIAENFSNVFSDIVPRPGWGKLRWVCDDDLEFSDEDDEISVLDVQRIRGIGLDISFSGTSKVQNVTCLSGGQRSVISLSLVFAILLMDRAPFYLLDEADMALDIAYRSKTAEMLNKFAKESQFIVTTFWPEMLPFAKNIIKVSKALVREFQEKRQKNSWIPLLVLLRVLSKERKRFLVLNQELFKGSFFYCEGPNILNVRNKTDCLSADPRNVWVNRAYNFDDLGQALMALFVFSSKDGWLNIIYTGLDAVGVDQQAIEKYSEWRLIYFNSFLLLVGFFVLNMFVGVVVENFHRCREEQEKEERARRLAKRARKMEKKRRNASPTLLHQLIALAAPNSRRFTSKYFDLAIAAVIGLNVATMAMEFYLMPPGLFIIESACKVIALGVRHYIRDQWNPLDVGIVIVILSIVSIVLEETKSDLIPINPTIIRVMRVLRIARVLKLLKMTKGIRSLLDTVMQALSQVGNLGLLFYLLFFISAALGVELFGRLECEHAHFASFGIAFLTLFRVATGDNWNGIMKDTLRENCNASADCIKNCFVSRFLAPIFVIFVLMAQFVLVNVVVAVLMKHLEESHKQSALKPEELFAMTGIEAGTDDDAADEAVRDAYPMITLSVASDTEAEIGTGPGRRQPTSANVNTIAS